jgi:hypothetical protein
MQAKNLKRSGKAFSLTSMKALKYVEVKKDSGKGDVNENLFKVV